MEIKLDGSEIFLIQLIPKVISMVRQNQSTPSKITELVIGLDSKRRFAGKEIFPNGIACDFQGECSPEDLQKACHSTDGYTCRWLAK